jgi:hypothetical protein
MKICIISTGRAGSTSLYHLIKSHLPNDYYTISEPWNKGWKRNNELTGTEIDMILKSDNVFIKTLIGQLPENENIKAFENWLFTFFDKIILLDRLDDMLQVESMAWHGSFNRGKSWHEKEFYDLEKIPKDTIDAHKIILNDRKNVINDYSTTYKRKIYYYEDIFIHHNMNEINEIFSSLGLKLNKKYLIEYVLSKETKVRINKDEIKLI